MTTTSGLVLDNINTRKYVKALRKRIRSSEGEVSENKKQKELIDGNLNDFLSFLDDYDFERGNAVTKDAIMDTNRAESKVNEMSGFVTKNDLMECLGPMFSTLEERISDKVDGLKKELTSKDEEINELKQKVHELELSTHTKCLRIHGVPEVANECTSTEITNTIKKNLDIDLNNKDFDECFRIGKKDETATTPRPIIVKFLRNTDRQAVYKSKSKLKGKSNKIYINEDLTMEKATLYKSVRDLQRQGYIWKTWTANSVIFFTHNDDKETPNKIDSVSDMEHIRQTVTPRKLPPPLPPRPSSSRK